MKNFVRAELDFSLCGLNCALCVMRTDGYCPGCGGGAGNQGCAIARCARDRGGIAYCFECAAYPCEKYEGIGEFDSFITHRNQLADMEKARALGVALYLAELGEKALVLGRLLTEYDDGRHKSFFHLAVNLLELSELRAAIAQADAELLPKSAAKERAVAVARRLTQAAERRGVVLKLHRKATPAKPLSK